MRAARRAAWLAGTVLSTQLALAAPALAQTTHVVPDTAPGVSTGTIVSPNASGVIIDGGTLTGGNLFHSFTTFDLAAGDTAAWVYSAGDPRQVNNVINRVTGGAPSLISGTIDSTALPNADFYFINPAGVVFGAGAHVNVPAAAYFSTASELRFADGAVYSAVTPSGSRLTVAPVASFGFLGGEGDLAVEDVSDFLPGGGALSLSAANLLIDDADIESFGALSLTAVGAQAASVPVAGAPNGPLSGSLIIADGSEVVSIGGSGAVAAQANEFLIDGSLVEGVEGAPVSIAAGDLTAQDGAAILSVTQTAPGGELAIFASGNLTITGAAAIATLSEGGGNAGALSLSAGALDVDGGQILSTASSDVATGGNAGGVTLSVTGAVSVLDGGLILTQADDPSGVGGDIRLTAGSVAMASGGAIEALASGDGAGGQVAISASGDITLSDGATIGSSTLGDGDAGAVGIRAASLEINPGADGAFLAPATISSDTAASGHGGAVTVAVTGQLAVTNGVIEAATSGFGDAGSVSVQAQSIDIEGGHVDADTESSGNAGDVTLATATLTLGPGTVISSSNDSEDLFDNQGSGNAGQIVVNVSGNATMNAADITSGAFDALGAAGDVTLNVGGTLALQNAGIDSQTNGAGSAGTVTINAGALSLVGSEINSESFPAPGASQVTGDAGQVTLNIVGALAMASQSTVTTDTTGSGKAGDVTVKAASIDLSGLSTLTSEAFETGAAGNVTVTTGTLTIEGAANPDGALNSGISTDTDGLGGDAGQVSITVAGDATVTSDGVIGSLTRGAQGNAGKVNLSVGGLLTLSGGGEITASSTGLTGTAAAGDVSISAARLILDGRDASGLPSSISSDTQDGPGGAISLAISGNLTIRNGAAIATDTFGAGAAGNIDITAGNLSIVAGAVQSSAMTAGQGGQIVIDVAGDMSLGDAGQVASSTFGTGDAGTISVRAASLELNGGAASPVAIISDTVGAGRGGVVTVAVTGQLSIIDGAIDAASSGSGDAGTVTVQAQILDIGAGGEINSAAFASGNGGGVEVTASTLTVSDQGEILSDTFGSGSAGSVNVTARTLLVDDAEITSSASPGATGQAGNVKVAAQTLTLQNHGVISTSSSDADPAGDILIEAPQITVDGVGSAIASANTGQSGGAAGAIVIDTDPITLSNGGSITTDSASGAAGAITLNFADGGLLILEGVSPISQITTTSATATAGQITINGPSAIIMNGGEIQALGPFKGAFVTIDAGTVIQSSDRLNPIAVAGTLVFDSQFEDVNQAVTLSDLSFVDASKVLRGECAAQVASGETSALVTSQTGPYATSAADPGSLPLALAQTSPRACGLAPAP